jgi:hypothetical protein
MGTWGEAERVVQPTDSSGLVGFRVIRRPQKEEFYEPRSNSQVLVGRTTNVVVRLTRGILLASFVLATLLAGGASLRAF